MGENRGIGGAYRSCGYTRGGGGFGGGKERNIEHEVAGCKVRGGAREVEEEGNVVGLEGGQSGGEVGGAVRVAISVGLSAMASKFWRKMGALPELEVDYTFNADLRDVIVVEECVCYA